MTDDGTATGTALSDFLSENIVYGIPICAITRRNDNAYVASTNAGNANQNGAIDRKPSSTTSTDATTLLQATLTDSLDAGIVGNVELLNGVGSGLDDAQLYGSERYLVLCEGLNREIIRVSGLQTPTSQSKLEVREVHKISTTRLIRVICSTTDPMVNMLIRSMPKICSICVMQPLSVSGIINHYLKALSLISCSEI